MAISGCGGLGSGGACSASTRHAASAPSSTSPLPSGCSSNRCLIGLRGLPARWSPHSGISSPRRRYLGRLERREALMLPAPERFRPARADWIQASICAVLLFTLYALTAPRTVALEDDGLFVLSSYFLGVEHPPGYPLFTLIGHLFTQDR